MLYVLLIAGPINKNSDACFFVPVLRFVSCVFTVQLQTCGFILWEQWLLSFSPCLLAFFVFFSPSLFLCPVFNSCLLPPLSPADTIIRDPNCDEEQVYVDLEVTEMYREETSSVCGAGFSPAKYHFKSGFVPVWWCSGKGDKILSD